GTGQDGLPRRDGARARGADDPGCGRLAAGQKDQHGCPCREAATRRARCEWKTGEHPSKSRVSHVETSLSPRSNVADDSERMIPSRPVARGESGSQATTISSRAPAPEFDKVSR